MTTCATCVHWKADTRKRESGVCTEVDAEPDLSDGAMFWVTEEHGYYVSGLKTRPGFGCNQWSGEPG